MMIGTGYIEPSAMTFVIHAVAGSVIAIGAVVVVLWRRAKKKVSEKLGLEEKSKKEVEDDIQIVEESETDK